MVTNFELWIVVDIIKKMCLMVKLICVVAIHICLNWKMYLYITFNVFKVNYI